MSDKIFTLSIIFFGLILLCFSYTVYADTKTCSPSATGSYKNEFTNPTNAYSQNDIYASGTTSTGDEQDYYSFGVTFPKNCDDIQGITVYIDGYASGTGVSCTVKLSYDGGTSWTGGKTTGNFGTSDTDTYLSVGGSSDTWGRTWGEMDFANNMFKVYLDYNALTIKTMYTDHVYIVITYDTLNFTMIENEVNVTGSTEVLYNDDVGYYKIWSNYTGNTTPLTHYENIINATGTHQHILTSTGWKIWANYTGNETNCTEQIENRQSSSNNNYQYGNCTCLNFTYYGEDSWYNFAWSCCTPINASDLKDMFNNSASIYMIGIYIPDYGYWFYLEGFPLFDFIIYPKQAVWVLILRNVSICFDDCAYDNITLHENIINATGDLTYIRNTTGYHFFANYTGNTTPLTHYENIINATGTHQHILTSTGWKIWANYTGNPSIISCPDKVYFNFSDENITISGYVNCSSEANNTNYTINDDNWLYLMGFSLDSGELGLIIVFCIFSLAFYVDKSSEKRNIWKPIFLFMDVPISFATGLYYIGFTANSIEFWIGIFMFLFAVLLSFGGIYYSINYGSR